MTINELLREIELDHMLLMEKALDRIRVKSCFKDYILTVDSLSYSVTFNLITLDFMTSEVLPKEVRSQIKFEIIEGRFLKWKFKKENKHCVFILCI